jgi:hypothetical protein
MSIINRPADSGQYGVHSGIISGPLSKVIAGADLCFQDPYDDIAGSGSKRGNPRWFFTQYQTA